MKNLLHFEYDKGVRKVLPTHPSVNNCLFTDDTEEEAMLLQAMATLAEKTGISVNELLHLFPAVLRMLKSKSAWAK